MQNFTRITFFLSAIFICNAASAQKDSTKSLEEVIITGQYKPQTLKNSVYQVRVINAQRIRLSGATNIQQILSTQLGFRFSNDNTTGISDASLNGMSGNNVKILLDGVPMVDRYDERVSLSQIDVNNIERIEIVEGPMSVSYGSDAMAGVINIITKKIGKNNLSVSAKVQEETAGDEYHPFNYRGVHNQNVNVNYRKDHFIFGAGGSHNEFDGFGADDYGRGQTWKPKEQFLANAKFGYAGSNFNIYYRLDYLNEKIISRDSLKLTGSLKTNDKTYTTDRYIHQVQGDYRFNKNLQWNGFLSYTYYKRATVTKQHDFQTGAEVLTNGAGEQDISKLNSLAFKNTFQYQLSSKISLQPGLDINHEKASGARVLGSPEINDYALFVSAEYKPTSKINIRPGLRFTKNSVYDAPPVIPSLNTKFTLSKNFDLRLAYGYGFRAPTLRELYLTFFDANHDLIGNPNLKAEYSNSFNGSLTWTPSVGKGINFSSVLSGFYNSYSNRIALSQIDPPNGAQYTYFNIDRSKTAGGSIDNRLAWKNIDATLGFSYTAFSTSYDAKTYVKPDGRDFLWTPELNTSIVYNVPAIKTSFALFYKLVGNKPSFSQSSVGSQPTILLTNTSAYDLADITINTRVAKILTVSAGVKNIFDVTNVNSNTENPSATAHSSTGPQSINYGRSYFLGLAFQWNKK